MLIVAKMILPLMKALGSCFWQQEAAKKLVKTHRFLLGWLQRVR